MKVDVMALAVRLDVALFLFSLTVAALFLIGTAQTFSENTLINLFLSLRWLSWIGLLATWLGLFPWSLHRGARVAALAAIGLGYLILSAFVLVWGAWVYPEQGAFPW